MATSVNVSATNNADIDGLLAGTEWSGTISYSFPTSSSAYAYPYSGGDGEPTTSGFSAAPTQMQAAINYAIALIQSYTNASIVYNGTGSADIMVAQSPAANPTSYAYYPGNYAAGGDVWFGTQYDYTQAQFGNYYFTTALHELGHAFGLKHSQETGGVANVAVPSAHDDSEYTVMSYRSYVGGPLTGYTNEAYGYPQTYMANDILALQTLYGANYNSHSDNTVYTWSPTTGQEFINGVGQLAPGGGVGGSANRIYETVWDGGGVDTYDLSNYTTGVTINLNPGASSLFSTAQLAYLGNGHYAAGNVYNAYLYNGDARSYIDNAVGGTGDDVIIGNAANNALWGGAGNDTINGGGGNDIIGGGHGVDIMTGGAGADAFVFGADDSSPVAGQHDRITDFTPGVDHIDLSPMDANTNTAAIDGFHFIATAAFDGRAGELDYYYDSAHGVTVLQGDTNGDRVADFAIDLVGNLTISASDIVGIAHLPVIDIPSTNVPAKAGQGLAASSLFSVSGVDHDSLTYFLFDSSTGPGAGHFVVNGTAMTDGVVFAVNSAQLAQTTFVAGSAGTTDGLHVMAFDGWDYSGNTSFSNFSVTVGANHPPVVTIPSASVSATSGQVLAASSLFSVSDADNDPLTYFLFDSSIGSNAGHFAVNGTTMTNGVVFAVNSAQLAQTTFVAGGRGATDSLHVMAFDGNDYSGNTSFSNFSVAAAADHPPVVTIPSASVPATSGQVLAASSLFSVSDADNDPLTYFLFDSTTGPNAGHFSVNGTTMTAGVVFAVNGAQLAQTTFVAGARGTTDSLHVMAFDGYTYSGNTSFSDFSVAAAANHPPVVSVPTLNVSASPGQALAASSLFSVSDADNDPLTYFLFDSSTGPNAGHFTVNGTTMTNGVVFAVNGAQLAQTAFVAGGAGAIDNLHVMAFDGYNYSGNTSFNDFHILA